MNRLKELRKARGLSLRALADKVGLTYSTLAYCERGEHNFSASSQQILADFFGVSVDYLLGKSAEEMYNSFVSSLQRDFVGVEMFSDGDVVQVLSPDVSEPIRSKIKILFLLQNVNDSASLDVITELVSHCGAVEDFSGAIDGEDDKK